MTFPFPHYAPTFSPSYLNPLLWLDFGDKSTLFQNSDGTNPVTATGQEVKSFRDKSSSGYLFSIVTANGATYTEGSYAPYLAFTGSQVYSGGNICNIGTGDKCIVVACSDEGNSNGYIISKALAGPGAYRIAMGRDTSVDQFFITQDIYAPIVSSTSSLTKTSCVWEGRIDRTNKTVTLVKNSVAQSAVTFTASSSTNMTTPYRFLVGGYADGTDTGLSSGLSFTGKMYSLVQIPTLSNAQLVTWSGNKMGLSL